MKYNLHLEASEKEFPLDPGLQVRLSVCPKFPPVQEPTYNLKAGKFLMAFELLLLLKSQNMDSESTLRKVFIQSEIYSFSNLNLNL